MRILQIAAGDFFSTYGGGQVYVKNIVDEMIQMGLDIVVISLIGKDIGIRQRDYNGIQLIEIGSVKNLEEAVKLAKVSVIHAHSTEDAVCMIGHQLGIPIVITAHHGGLFCPAGSYMNYKDQICDVKVNHMNCLPCVLRNTRTGLKLWYPLVRHLKQSTYLKIGNFLQNKPFIPFISPIGGSANCILAKQHQFSDIAKYCNFMIAPSYRIAEAMLTNGLDRSKLRIVPHGIPLPKIQSTYPDINQGKLKLCYVGRICYIKGIHIFLKALSMINNPNIELHLIGTSGNKSEHRYLLSLQKKYRHDRRIIWHGKVPPDQVYEILAQMHVSCAPSICLETYGLSIAESLAMGVPVIASRCGGAEMQIQDGVNGCLIPQNDAVALAEAIRHYAEHPEELKQMSSNCKTISIGEHVSELLKVYQEAIETYGKSRN